MESWYDEKMFFLILSIGMIILSSYANQSYKRIIAEEGVEWGRETVVLGFSSI